MKTVILAWVLGCGGVGLLVVVMFHSCSMMDRAAAKNPLYRVPVWVQDCAKRRPLADCERDWQTLEERRAR